MKHFGDPTRAPGAFRWCERTVRLWWPVVDERTYDDEGNPLPLTGHRILVDFEDGTGEHEIIEPGPRSYQGPEDIGWLLIAPVEWVSRLLAEPEHPYWSDRGMRYGFRAFIDYDHPGDERYGMVHWVYLRLDCTDGRSYTWRLYPCRWYDQFLREVPLAPGVRKPMYVGRWPD